MCVPIKVPVIFDYLVTNLNESKVSGIPLILFTYFFILPQNILRVGFTHYYIYKLCILLRGNNLVILFDACENSFAES